MTERRRSAQSDDTADSPSAVSDSDRRRFLDLCGKFAVGMPPAITLLLSPFPGHADNEDPPVSPCPPEDDDDCPDD